MSAQAEDARLAQLGKANKILSDHLAKDANRIPDPGNVILSVSSSSAYTPAPNHAWTPFEIRKTMMIPDDLFADYEPTKSTCSMGLFPEIDRAWISLNNKFFFWDYITSKDSLQSFPEQAGIINHAGLIKPKPGIFIESMHHLLVICTATTLVVLGLAMPETPADPGATSREFVIYDTELRFSTDNVQMTSIVSTASGRAFMCGVTDGNLYEMNYQAKEGWFGGKCSLYNHSTSGMATFLPSLFVTRPNDSITSLVVDDSRNLLYALTSRSTIILYSLAGPGVNALQRVAVASNLLKRAQSLCPTLGQNRLDITSIQTMPASESDTIHLVAISTTGVRLYFTTAQRGYGAFGATTSTSGTVSTLDLVHVRTAPSNLYDPRDNPTHPSDSTFRPASSINLQAVRPPTWFATNLSTTGYHAGLLLASQSSLDENEQDVLLCTAPELSKVGNLRQDAALTPIAPTHTQYSQYGQLQTPSARPIFSEFTSLIPMSGKTWAIAHLPSSAPSTAPRSQALRSWNELASQFTSHPEQFLILTNDGLCVVVKRRAVECLKDLIEMTRRGSEEDLIALFFEQYGRDQACAMCLALATSNSFISTPSSSAPLSSSQAYTVAQQRMLQSSAQDTLIDEATSSSAKTLFYELGQQPIVHPGGTSSTFSGRHEGLAIYFSRLVRPIWRSNITKGPTTSQTTNVPVPLLSVVQRNLQSLKLFLDRNPQLFLPPGNYSSIGMSNDVQQGAWKDEEASAIQLRELLALCIEAISFILLLIDYKLPETIALCELPLQQKLQSMTWEDLLTTKAGKDVGKGLVTAVINQQISQQISIDTISEVLQSRCPNFCSTDDVMLYKAVESLRRAKETRNATERGENLRESLRLLLKSTRNLQLSSLKEVCEDYRQMVYPNGAIELPLKCAQEWDSDFQGRDFWAAGCPDGDARKNAYDLRAKCYNFVLETLSAFDEALNKASTEVAAVEAEVAQNNGYRLALNSDDPVFHSYLYDWFIQTGRTNQLLDIQTPYIENHLRREPQTWPKCELLWQFYVNHGMFLRAAETLADLAENRDFGMKLDKRVEYLSLATGNAKSYQVSEVIHQEQAPVEFLNDLEEKLEVANVQMELLDAMRTIPNLDEEGVRKVEHLSSVLIDISTMYHGYAEAYQLYDTKLYILKVSDHRDPYVVASTWEAIFAQASADAGSGPAAIADRITRLGRKLYPSDNAFPVDLLGRLVEEYAWVHRNDVPRGWGPQTLLDSGIPYEAVFEPLYLLRESGQPPYHTTERELFLIEDITSLMYSWLEEALRPGSRIPRGSFPVNLIDETVAAYLKLVPAAPQTETTRMLAELQSKIHHRF